jgi:hypothetical protein
MNGSHEISHAHGWTRDCRHCRKTCSHGLASSKVQVEKATWKLSTGFASRDTLVLLACSSEPEFCDRSCVILRSLDRATLVISRIPSQGVHQRQRGGRDPVAWLGSVHKPVANPSSAATVQTFAEFCIGTTVCLSHQRQNASLEDPGRYRASSPIARRVMVRNSGV